VLNALTVDLEDWRQLVHRKMTGETVVPSAIVVEETEAILQLLEAHGTRATFFVLANIAEWYPALLRRIVAAGHEIGSHGLSHELLWRLPLERFRDETRRAKAQLQEVAGVEVRGYRAAEFSITPEALSVLADEGFTYDSSLYPLGRVDPKTTVPHTVRTSAGPIAEFPLLTMARGRRRWAVGGGGPMHLLPQKVLSSSIQRANREGNPAVLYVHPYDVATRRLKPISRPRSSRQAVVLARHATVHNVGRRHAMRTLTGLLQRFEFGTVASLLASVGE